MLRDFLIGTLGKLLRVLFLVAGFIILLGGIFTGSMWGIVIGIVLLCMAAGIQYALGNIVKMRR